MKKTHCKVCRVWERMGYQEGIRAVPRSHGEPEQGASRCSRSECHFPGLLASISSPLANRWGWALKRILIKEGIY